MGESTTGTPGSKGGEGLHPVGTYLTVWGWLFILSVISYLADLPDFPREWVWVQWTLITLLALVKATLIAQFFMHLKWERLTLVYAVVAPVALVLLLLIFLVSEAGYIAEVRRALLGE